MTLSLVAASCSSDSESATTEAPVSTAAPAVTAAPDTAAPDTVAPTDTAATDTTAPADTAAPDPGTDDPSAAYPNLAPPTGEEMVIGLANTEGTPGLDFPEIRLNIASAIDYLNQHGGVGGRPIEIENCTVNGSPETSQACAQELTGKGVELVMVDRKSVV